MNKILIFLGPPGSGKGTQAKLFAAKNNYAHVSTGDLLRALLAKPESEHSDEEKSVLAEMKKGGLVSDDFICRLVFQAIDEWLAKKGGVVLDGAVRTLAQAEKIYDFASSKNLADEVLAVAIMLTDEESFNRLSKRRICVKCGEIIPWLEKTKGLVVCPKCGGELKIRSDDNEEVIRDRIKVQGNAALSPLLDYFEKLGKLKIVDGTPVIEEVEKSVAAAIV